MGDWTYFKQLFDLTINDGLLRAPFVLRHFFISFICGKLIQRLYREAYKDLLTGLSNRRYLYEKMPDEMKGLKNKFALSFVMIVSNIPYKGHSHNIHTSISDNILPVFLIFLIF